MSATNSTTTLSQSTCITLAFLMGLLAFAIMLGNAIVILAFVVDKNLRHRSNYFFLNLAISDFFVGVISIPLYIPYRLFDWKFDKICVLWLTIDYLLCTASVYNIVLITYDRYQSVSNAVSYRAQHTGIRKIVALMVAIWVLAFLVHGPIIIVSDSWERDREHCEAGFISKWYILAITSFFEFLAPVFLVAYFNIYIYWRLWKRGHLSRWQSHPGLTSSACSGNSECTFKSGLFSRASLAEPKGAAVSLHFKRRERKSSLLFSIRTQKNSDIIASKMGSLSHAESLALHQREHLELLKARKLAKSLAILLGVFTICWGPYFLFTFVLSFYGQNRHPQNVLYEITFVLQWCNSFVNPFLYPLCHKRFQKAFLKIFCMKKQPILPHNQPVSA
ncbi:histamine H4 receptor isoform 1-T1 [Hipposideros larvatus]